MFSLKPKTYSASWRTKAKKAFTLIEMAIVIAVIVIVSVVVYANYNEINDAGEVLALSESFRGDVHSAQNFSAIGKMVDGGASNGWGVFVDRTTNKYTVFADLNNSKTYDFPVRLLIHGGSITDDSKFNRTSLITNNGSLNAVCPSGGGKPNSNNGCLGLFNGTSQYLYVLTDTGATSSLNFAGNDFTIDTWFYLSDLLNDRPLVSQKTAYDFYILTDGSLNFKFWDGSAETHVSSTAGIVATGSWQHAAVTRKGQFIYLFLNSVVKSAVNIGVKTMFGSSSNTYIGGSEYGIFKYMKGHMSETRIVNGWANWTMPFTTSTVAYSNDPEKHRQVKLNPGIVFESLYNTNSLATNTTSLNIFFSPTNYLTYVDTVSTTAPSAIVILNKGGARLTYATGDTPKAWRIWPSGLINATSTR